MFFFNYFKVQKIILETAAHRYSIILHRLFNKINENNIFVKRGNKINSIHRNKYK